MHILWNINQLWIHFSKENFFFNFSKFVSRSSYLTKRTTRTQTPYNRPPVFAAFFFNFFSYEMRTKIKKWKDVHVVLTGNLILIPIKFRFNWFIFTWIQCPQTVVTRCGQICRPLQISLINRYQSYDSRRKSYKSEMALMVERALVIIFSRGPDLKSGL